MLSCLYYFNMLFNCNSYTPIINDYDNDNYIDKYEKKVIFNNDSLSKLRHLMKLNNITTYIIPSEDSHQSEYTAIQHQRRQFITNFTGSSGIAIITLYSAALSTDSRYFIQAEKQLNKNDFILLKQGIDENWIDWMINETINCINHHNKDSPPFIAVDPTLITYDLSIKLKSICYENNLTFVQDLDYNLIDKIKPKINIPTNQLFIYDLKYSGVPIIDKLSIIRNEMLKDNIHSYISGSLDSIAWLLNLRGNDIEYNPVFFSYIIITHNEITLYIDKRKITNILTYLEENNIMVKNYNQIWDDLPALKSNNIENNNILLDLNTTSAIFNSCPSIYNIKFRSLLTELKGIKNSIEIQNLRKSQLFDSIAIIKLFYWIYSNCENTKITSLTELDIVSKLENLRYKNENYRGPSFKSIIATGLNSAIVHYEPTILSNCKIKDNNILLLDIGGQYLNGTTDITRSIFITTDNTSPNDKIKLAYSLVLSGHINVSKLKFKYGTSNEKIDSIAREDLKKFNMTYGHGTGHGIDNFICVHSGPAGLAPNKTSYNYKLLNNGSFISIEPGYYLENEFGIRIESDILVQWFDEFNKILNFEYTTLVPFCNELIDIKYLSNEQIKWINNYHENIRNIMKDYLNNDEYEWLVEYTKDINLSSL